MTETTTRQRDWLPWIILLLLGIALAAVVFFKRGEDKIAGRTAQSGLPLTAEQKAVSFDTADLSFEILPSKKAIDAVAKLGFTVKQPIDKLQLDLDPRYKISSLKLDGQELDKGRWANDGGLLTVNFPAPKAAGQKVAIDIAYAGKPHVAKRAPWDGGFVWAKAPTGEPWIASAVQGEGCDMFWPCFDNAMVEVAQVTQHITVPEGLTAASNGKMTGMDTLEDGRRRFHWVARYPNNYAIAINVGPYEKAEAMHTSRFGNHFPIEFWYLPGEEKQAKALLQEMVQTVDFFEATVGPYPFGDEKVGVVETPHLGMEHQTINAYGNKYKAAPYGYDWLFNHEFAHEWFGNQLTNSDWDDMWLHEGFGSYMQPLSVQWMGGDMAYNASLFEQRQRILNKHPVVWGKSRTEHEVYDDEKGSGIDIYMKGSWILHTLRGMMGDEPFFRSVRRLVYGRPDPMPGNFQPRFGSTQEFQDIVSQEAGRDMKWFFDVYLRQAALPRLEERRSGTTLDLQWKTPKGLPFPMPVEVAVDGVRQTVAMANGQGRVTLPRPNAIVTVDPGSKILRQSDAMDRYRDSLKKGPPKK